MEEFIEKEGCSSDTDCFSVDGELKFVSFSAQRFDEKAANPYTPSAFSWPSTMTKEQEAELTSELQRVLHLLGMRTSIYNVETRIGKNGKTYIMEVSPRGGGNRLAEMLRYATGVDLITNAVRAAVVKRLSVWNRNLIKDTGRRWYCMQIRMDVSTDWKWMMSFEINM